MHPETDKLRRHVEADYRAAYIRRHAELIEAGRTEEAEAIAAILREHYGHDVHSPAAAKPEEPTPSPVPGPSMKRRDVKAPENTAGTRPE